MSENGDISKMEIPDDEVSEKSETSEESETPLENSIKLHCMADSQGIESRSSI